MKNIRLIYLLLLSICLGSCDEFLEPKSQNKLIPTKVEHLKEFLLGEVIQKSSNPTAYLLYMTDNVMVNFPKGEPKEDAAAYWGYFTWQSSPENTRDNDINADKAWNSYYHDVFTCNIILEQVEDMEGYKSEKDIVKAETYFMRANAYFTLVNLYGEPYDKDNADNLLGVPINDETGILDKRYKRSSVYEVYEKIESDLNNAIKLFESTPSYDYNIARPNIDAAYLLKSRIALYKKEYANVVDAVDKLLANSSKDVVDIRTWKSYRKKFIAPDNPELLFCHGKFKNLWSSPVSSYVKYTPAIKFTELFKDNDLRKNSFSPPKIATPFSKYDTYGVYGKVFRMSEAILNKAEALACMEGDRWQEGIDFLNARLRQRRFDEGEEYQITVDSKQTAIDTIRTERRIELCLEEHRWFDLRRYGMPELKHLYGPEGAAKEYVLEKGSKSYTLPVPIAIIEKNNLIEQIERKQQPK